MQPPIEPAQLAAQTDEAHRAADRIASLQRAPVRPIAGHDEAVPLPAIAPGNS